MITDKQLHYIKHEQIDKDKWDACIEASSNGLIYAYSWWLDHMAKHWDALVLNDYEAVMPLTWNIKYGITYLYQPPFTQQSGIFCSYPVSEELIGKFLDKLQGHFKFAEIFLNYSNKYQGLGEHANYILPLAADYSALSLKYTNVLNKNLKRAANKDMFYVQSNDYKKIIGNFADNYKSRLPHIKRSDYLNLETLGRIALERNQLVVREVYTVNKKFLSAVLLLKDSKRLYLILSVTPGDARALQPNHFLIDNLIREYAGQNLILDFEGSDIPGIADYYQSFGSINQPYFFYRFNHLPWPLSLLKKRS